MRKTLSASLALLAFAAAPAALARPITATDLATMRRIGAPAVSPDGRTLVYQLRETDLAANRGRTDLWFLDLSRPGAQPARLLNSPEYNEGSPSFSPDSEWIYFISNRSGDDQVWRKQRNEPPSQVTSVEGGLSGYSIAPTGDRIAIWADRDMRCTDANCADIPTVRVGQGSGRVYDETFVRHWDTWSEPGVRSRIFTFPLVDGVAQGAGTPLAPRLVGDAPTKPFGGAEEIAWSPDGRTLYFTMREAGRHEPNSTNMDIFAVPADGSAAPTNLTAANEGMDTGPVVSPDGRWLAYTAMARATYEADRQVVQLRDLRSGETRALTQAWDRSVGSIAWAPDGRSLLVTAGDTLDTPVFRVDAGSGRVTRLTQAGTAGNVVPLPDGSILYTLNSLTAPDDLWRLSRRGGPARLTAVNADKLDGLDPVSVRRFHFAGAHGDTVWGQIVEPVGGTERLPTLLLIHGGPQGSFGNGWSYRWNPWVFAAPGYGAVTVDFHGSTGYGQAFTDAINRDWGGAPLQDLRLGLAAAGREDPRLDISNACALGGSYGGFMVDWIAGNWNDGFKCLVSHSGVFDQRSMAYETEELWFNEWEFGGPYYSPAAAANYERSNPVNFVQNWRTPMLVIHGERDFRIPYSQSLGVFNALQRLNIPSRLVVFPDENHWILKPQNSIQWYREVHGWLNQWLRGGRQASTQ
ncbi:MAG: S9 family peptidase [Alphaproteobacteria bacterium]|nr:MAG: S9 family peptidase [Alphaproteobacteria bacterium]